MNCRQARPLLSAYLDRQLHAWEKLAVTTHSDACPDCQAEIRSILQLKNVLRAQPLPGLPAAVCAKIQQDTVLKKSATATWFAARWWVPTLTLAVAAAGLLTMTYAERLVERRDQLMILASAPENFHPYGAREKIASTAAPRERTRHESMY